MKAADCFRSHRSNDYWSKRTKICHIAPFFSHHTTVASGFSRRCLPGINETQREIYIIFPAIIAFIFRISHNSLKAMQLKSPYHPLNLTI